MTHYTTTSGTLTAYVSQIPIVLIWLFGISWAIVHWQKHPQVSLLAVLAFGIGLLDTLGGTYVQMSLMYRMIRSVDSEGVPALMGILTYVRCGLSAVSLGLVTAAVFGWRTPRLQS